MKSWCPWVEPRPFSIEAEALDACSSVFSRNVSLLKNSGEGYFFTNATNCSTVRPLARMRLRSVPGASSRWSGTERVAQLLSFAKIIWLPLCRDSAQLSRPKAFTTARPLSFGKPGIRRQPRLASSRWSAASRARPSPRGKVRWLRARFSVLQAWSRLDSRIQGSPGTRRPTYRSRRGQSSR